MPRETSILPALFGSKNKLPLSYEQKLQALAEKRRFAQALRAQALQKDDPGKMVSGHYIADPWSGLANVAKAWMAKRDLDSTDTEEADIVAQREEEFGRAINEVPQDVPGMTMGGAPGEQEAPTVVPEKKASPQDWIKWGGRMSTLGPQGQAVGGAAISRGMESLLPRLGNPTDWEVVEQYDEKTGRAQKVLLNKKDPRQVLPFGGVKAEGDKRPNTFQEQLVAHTELQALYRKRDNGQPWTKDDEDRAATLTAALRGVTSVGSDGGVVTVNTPQVARAGAVGAVGAVPVSIPPSAPGDARTELGKVTPAEQAERDRKALELKMGERSLFPEGSKERAALETDIAQTQAKIAANDRRASGLPAAPADEWAEYRKGGAKYDPRNDAYLAQPPGPGVMTARAGSGPQQRLNNDVQALGKVADAEAIPSLDAAWARTQKAFAAARDKAKEATEERKKGRTVAEDLWDRMRPGGGVGGFMGINNILPQVMTSAEGQELRSAIETLKGFDRNALFGQTLTGLEKASFDKMVGDMFGVDDENFKKMLSGMEARYAEKKRNVFSSFAPIVVDTYYRGSGAAAAAANGGRKPSQPWLNTKSF